MCTLQNKYVPISRVPLKDRLKLVLAIYLQILGFLSLKFKSSMAPERWYDDYQNIRTNKLKHNLWCCFELFSILGKIFKAQGRWKIKVGRCLTKLLFCLVLLALIFIFHLWPCDLEKEKCAPATFDFNFERTIDIDGPPQLKTSTNSQDYFYEIWN